MTVTQFTTTAPPFILQYAAPAVRQAVGPVKWLIIHPFLARLVTIGVEIALAVTAPWVLPFLPLVEEFLGWVNPAKVGADAVDKARQVVAMYRSYDASQLSEPVRYAMANPDTHAAVALMTGADLGTTGSARVAAR